MVLIPLSVAFRACFRELAQGVHGIHIRDINHIIHIDKA
jgi:hypothetical protein